MVYKSGQIFLPFCHNSRVWRTDGRTDRILIARPRLHSMQRGKKPCNILMYLIANIFTAIGITAQHLLIRFPSLWGKSALHLNWTYRLRTSEFVLHRNTIPNTHVPICFTIFFCLVNFLSGLMQRLSWLPVSFSPQCFPYRIKSYHKSMATDTHQQSMTSVINVKKKLISV